MLDLKAKSWVMYTSCKLCSHPCLELASSNDENASLHSGGDTTPVMERKTVRFLSRDNSLGVEDKVSYLSNIQTMSDDNM